MKFPRVRFTMRRMMVAVAVVALLLWGGLLVSRSIYCELVARALSRKQQVYLVDIAIMEQRARRGLTPREARDLAYGYRMADYIDRMRANYRRTARSPWLPVPRDPRTPK